MARVRDYKAEYEADKRRAARLGFESQRKLRAARRVWKSNAATVLPDWAADADEQYKKMQSRMYQECQRWSEQNAATSLVMFMPGTAAEHGLALDEYIKLYHKALVDNSAMEYRSWKKGVGRKQRKSAGNRALRRWFTDFGGMTDAEYETRYGNPYTGR